MTDYTKTTDFAAKDSLPSGDSGKIIRGAEFGTEFDNIQTAVNSKSNTENPAFTGNITVTGTVDGRDIAADGTKLDTVETNADVTDTANVTAAGALMDSEVTNLDQVKAFDSSDYATAAQGTTADNALPKTGGAMTGAITTNSTFDGRDVATDGTKLDGIEASADVTDTANVTAAGALMDSELTSIASVKALNQGVATTNSPTFAGVTANGTVEFDGLSGTGAVTVTDILDQDDMSGNSATALATQQSIKAYVDSQVGTVDTLAEVLANGNATGGTDIAFGDNDKALFGAGNDLQIYHDGSNSFIDDTGTGSLVLQSNGAFTVIQNSSGVANARFDSAGAASIRYNGVEKLATTATGIDVTGVITTEGITTSANISFGDGDRAVFGAGSDLQVFHDGSNSYIADNGTGDLFISGAANITFRKSGTSEVMAQFSQDGAASLYHDKAAKLATTSTGIDVTGTATMDGLAVNTTNGSSVFEGTGISSVGIQFKTNASNRYLIQTPSASADLAFLAGGTTKSLNLGSNGNVQFFEDTGTTAKFHWDAADERLGIGTSNPISMLQLLGSPVATSGALATFRNSDATASNTTFGGILFNSSPGTDFSIGKSNVNSATTLSFRNGNTGASYMDIASDGKVGIGTDDPEAALTVTPESGNFNATYNSYDGVGLFLRGNGTAGNGNYGPALVFGSADSDGTNQENKHSAISMVQTGTDANQAGLAFWVHPTDSSTADLDEAMRITSDGLVGIGTSDPSGKLDVELGLDGVIAEFRGADSDLIQIKGASNTIALDTRNTAALTFEMQGSERMRIDSSGNVGIGAGNSKEAMIQSTNSGRVESNPAYSFNGDLDTGMFNPQTDNTIAFATGGTEAMRIDSSQNLLVGKTSASVGTDGAQLLAGGYSGVSATSTTAFFVNRNTTDGDVVELGKNGVKVGSIGTAGSRPYISSPSASLHSGLIFTDNGSNGIIAPSTNAGAVTNGTIDLGYSGGRFKDLHLSGGINLGGPSEINASIAYLRSSSTNTSSLTLRKAISSADAVDYVQCRNDANTLKLVIEGSGDIKNTNNSYGAISDEKLKENIVDATSQWDDIKAVRVRKYSLKEDGLDAPNMLGVVAQELESAGMNGLVSESVDRNENNANLGTVTKSVNYSILYMKAVKALQEAMVRIESLEAEVSALKGD